MSHVIEVMSSFVI